VNEASRESLNPICTAAGMPKFGFLDLRHHFISTALVSGAARMTIASWV
jgi:hypothetical protein